MHRNSLGLGIRPRLHWGVYSTPPDSLVGFKGPTSKAPLLKEGEERGREERERRQNYLCSLAPETLAPSLIVIVNNKVKFLWPIVCIS